MADARIWWRERRDGVEIAHLQWRDSGGKQRSQSLRTSDKRVAAVFLKAKRRELDSAERGSRTHYATVQDALQGFLAEKALTTRPATVAQYRQRLEWLLDAWRDAPVSVWDRARYAQFLESRNWSARSIELQTAICKMFIVWAHESGFPIPDFIGGYKSPRVYRKKPTTLTGDEVGRLLAEAHGHPLEPAIALGALAGLRLGEIQSSCWEDVDWAEGVLNVHGTKTHRDRSVPLSPRLRAVLERHRGPRRRVVRAGCSIKSLKGICRRAGVPEVSWHPLRHTCATQLFRKGVPATTIRDWLGHVSIATTNIYGHSSREDLRKAAEALG